MPKIIFSDSHLNPDKLSDEFISIIDIAKREQATLIGNGDLLNLLPWGYEQWVGCPCLRQLQIALNGYPLTYITGNHDPYPWVKKLFRPWLNIDIRRSLTLDAITDSYLPIEIRHGHRWALDWKYLRHIAPPLTEFMTETFPEQWYWFCRERGWLPSLEKEKGEDSRDYRKAIDSVWRGAAGRAYRKKERVICGHTHCEALTPAFVDCGTLKDGEYVRIGEKIELCKLR